VDGLHIPIADGGADVCAAVVDANAREGVTWVHSYVSDDKHMSYCVYDAPSPEAIRKTAACNVLPSTASPRFGCSTRTSTTRSDSVAAVVGGRCPGARPVMVSAPGNAHRCRVGGGVVGVCRRDDGQHPPEANARCSGGRLPL